MSNWIVVGISGVTNGGKSTLTNKLQETLPCPLKVINQDDYFYSEDSSHHVPAPGDVKHHNWDIISSLDMAAMTKDVLDVINSKVPVQSEMNLVKQCNTRLEADTSSCERKYHCQPVLLLDGFLLYDHEKLATLCNLKYFLTLNREQCRERRKTRDYDPPDPPGYFDSCVWPMYEAHLKRIETMSDIVVLDGTDDPFKKVYDEIMVLAKSSPVLLNESDKKHNNR